VTSKGSSTSRPEIRLFETLRYPSSQETDQFAADAAGNRSFFAATQWPNWPGLAGKARAQSSKGIDAIGPVAAVDGGRRPAIIIDSNPAEAGSSWTPWHDQLDPEDGHIRYYGDNKPDRGLNPLGRAGNKVLVDEQFILHQGRNREERLRAAPLVFFESAGPAGESSGYRRFIGFGLIERTERIAQVEPERQMPGGHRRGGRLYLNYRFDCILLDLSSENSALGWDWIAARADRTKSLEDCLAYAPATWRRWVEIGMVGIDSLRQRVLRYRLRTVREQLPEPGTPAARALQAVIDRYAGSDSKPGVGRHRFEGFAAEVTGAIFSESGAHYRSGWITRQVADHGVDFVGRLDQGVPPAVARQVVLGQAKCHANPKAPTNAVDLARTVARLDRGWLGVFVTTGNYSANAQREVLEDRYPIMLIDGRTVGEVAVRQALAQGVSVERYIDRVDGEYASKVLARRPEEILTDP
jgi:hypothetical protein